MQLREFLPKTLFGRMLSIILVPMIFVQVITVFIFYERHWDTVTRHMAQNLAGEMALLVSDIGRNPSNRQKSEFSRITFRPHCCQPDGGGRRTVPREAFLLSQRIPRSRSSV